MYVFGYGSLVSASSVSRSLQRTVTEADLPAARLNGYRRDFGIGVPVAFDDGLRCIARFLDVQPAGDGSVLGALVHVTDAEFAVLATREAQYDAVDVTELIDVVGPGGAAIAIDGPVIAFSGRAEHRRAGAEDVLPQRYLDMVSEAVASRGAGFAAEFWQSTLAAELPRHSGSYRFADPAQEQATRPS